MAFVRECKNIDNDRMESDKIEHKVMDKIEIKIIPKYWCNAKGDWIRECPDGCKLFS